MLGTELEVFLGEKTVSGYTPALALFPTYSVTAPRTHTTVWNYIRAGSGKLVCGAHSCCINIYKTCWWTLQMSKCLLFRLLCQYLLRTGSMGILQGFCLFGGLVLGMEIQQAFLSRWIVSPTSRSPRGSPSLHG